MQKANSFAVSFLQKLPKFTVNAVKVVYSLLVTLVISIHALVKKEKLIGFAKRSVMNMLPDDTAAPILKYGSFTNTTFKKYITGQLVSCLIIGVLCYIGMRIFGMPYPELISVFICVAALVPIVGPWVSTIPSALIILMTRQDNPWLALWFIVMVVGIQQIDDNFVYPRIVGDAVGIPGILVISAAILAGGLFGQDTAGGYFTLEACSSPCPPPPCFTGYGATCSKSARTKRKRNAKRRRPIRRIRPRL